MPKEAGVVYSNLRVEGQDLAVFGGDERVDLDEARVGLLEGAVEPLDDLAHAFRRIAG